MRKNVLPGFKLFADWFHQDFFVLYEDLETGLRETLAMMTAQQRVELALDLESLLDGRFDDEELTEIWNLSRAEFFFSPNAAIRQILTQVRDLLSAT